MVLIIIPIYDSDNTFLLDSVMAYAPNTIIKSLIFFLRKFT